MIQWSGISLLIALHLNIDQRSQLDAIPTIGFSDPILSYLSAVRYSFDCARMINEGYKKVNCLSLCAPSSYQVDGIPTVRQGQVYSKSLISSNGWCWLPGLSWSMISGRPQMMSYLGLNESTTYAHFACKTERPYSKRII